MQDNGAFFLGLLVAGLIGFLSSQIVAGWNTVDRTHNRMFHNVPQPVLRHIPHSNISGVGTEPDESPLQVLLNGCREVFLQILMQIILFTALGMLIWYNLQQELSDSFLVGIIFALVFGILWQQISNNWAIILALYRAIVNSPKPTLKRANPPNQHYVAAWPPFPACSVVVNNSIEIGVRFVWHLILLYLFFQSISAAYFYLTEGAVRFSIVGIFSV